MWPICKIWRSHGGKIPASTDPPVRQVSPYPLTGDGILLHSSIYRTCLRSYPSTSMVVGCLLLSPFLRLLSQGQHDRSTHHIQAPTLPRSFPIFPANSLVECEWKVFPSHPLYGIIHSTTCHTAPRRSFSSNRNAWPTAQKPQRHLQDTARTSNPLHTQSNSSGLRNFSRPT